MKNNQENIEQSETIKSDSFIDNLKEKFVDLIKYILVGPIDKGVKGEKVCGHIKY